MIRFLGLFFIVLLYGCSQKIEYLYIKQPNVGIVKRKKISISIEEIKLPFYLNDAKVPYIEDGEIKFFDDSYFSENANEFITKRAIDVLKRALHTQNIFLYPWNLKKDSYILDIEIGEFIAKDKKVYLKASWRLLDRKRDIIKSGIFNRSKKYKKLDKKEIIDAMRRLFDSFIVDIAKKI